MAVRRAEHVAWREVAGETVVVDLQRHLMYGLNPSAGVVWGALEQPRTLDEVVVEVAGRLAGSSGRADLRHEVHAFLGELEEVGLVSGAPEPTATGPGPTSASPGRLSPRIVFREELMTFGASCGEIPGQSYACNQNPVGGGLPGRYTHPGRSR